MSDFFITSGFRGYVNGTQSEMFGMLMHMESTSSSIYMYVKLNYPASCFWQVSELRTATL